MKFRHYLAKCGPFAWTLHNLVAHPVSEMIFLASFGRARRMAAWVHDVTVPCDP